MTCSFVLSSFFVKNSLSRNERAHYRSIAQKTLRFIPRRTLALKKITLSVDPFQALTIYLNLDFRAKPRFYERLTQFGLYLFLRVQQLWKSRRSNLCSQSLGMIRNPINFIRISIEIGFFFISYVIFTIASLVRLARDRHDLKHFFLILLLKCCFATTDIAPSSFNSFETLRILISI